MNAAPCICVCGAHPHDPTMAVAWENLCGHLVTAPLLLPDLLVSVTCVAQGSYI